MGKDESKLSFLRTSEHFYRALAILEPQIYVVSEQFEAENISLLNGRLVCQQFIEVFCDWNGGLSIIENQQMNFTRQ